jgi:flagellar basal body-associated protein FliL
MTVERETFHEQIRQNKIRSILLMLVIVAILGALGYFMGFYFAGDPASAIIFIPFGMGLAALLSVGALFGGDSLVLTASQARQVTEQEQPQLVNVVRELSLAANEPCQGST